MQLLIALIAVIIVVIVVVMLYAGTGTPMYSTGPDGEIILPDPDPAVVSAGQTEIEARFLALKAYTGAPTYWSFYGFLTHIWPNHRYGQAGIYSLFHKIDTNGTMTAYEMYVSYTGASDPSKLTYCAMNMKGVLQRLYLVDPAEARGVLTRAEAKVGMP